MKQNFEKQCGTGVLGVLTLRGTCGNFYLPEKKSIQCFKEKNIQKYWQELCVREI